jgi:catechol 2,3-dioxygenase-like lactoylglutathione lyase family enzyme
MGDRATPNLPSRDLAATSAFYARIGFVEGFRDDGWLILDRHGITLEFFPFAEVDPGSSWFSCCLRLDDVDAFFEACLSAGIPLTDRGWPRLHRPEVEASGLRIGALIDQDGTLLRLIQNPESSQSAAARESG